jgi:phosphate uptake regulator
LLHAITRVSEARARGLLACLRFITELERVGDLMLGVANRLRLPSNCMPPPDTTQCKRMASLLVSMIEKVREGFEQLDISAANEVLGLDRELDRTRHAIFRRHAARHPSRGSMSVQALFIAQAPERAGGHYHQPR